MTSFAKKLFSPKQKIINYEIQINIIHFVCYVDGK